MKKHVFLALTLVALLAVLAGCGCQHEWKDASCDVAKTCSLCGVTEGEALGHKWDDGTCDAPKTCSVCKKTDGAALGHKWSDATCDAPKTCSVCKKTDGAALGHDWQEATCAAPKTCSRCNLTEGEKTEHTWVDATTEAPKTCTVCGATEGDKIFTDDRFHTADCESLFGTWIYEENIEGYIYQQIVIFRNDGTAILLESGMEPVDACYYVSDGRLYVDEEWLDEMLSYELGFSGDQMILTEEFGTLVFKRFSDDQQILGHGGKFDPAQCQDLIGTWRLSAGEWEGITMYYLFSFYDDGVMRVTIQMAGVETPVDYVYYVQNGTVYYAENWYATTMLEATYVVEGNELLWTEDGVTNIMNRVKAAGEADERFDPDQAAPLFGTWQAEQVVDLGEQMEMPIPGEDLTYKVFAEIIFNADGSYVVKSTIDPESYLRVMRIVTIESTYAEAGVSRDEADAMMMAAIGMTIPQYVDAILAELDVSELNQEMTCVYYVQDGKLYDAPSWDVEMDVTDFSIEGNLLTMEDEEMTMVFTKVA